MPHSFPPNAESGYSSTFTRTDAGEIVRFEHFFGGTSALAQSSLAFTRTYQPDAPGDSTLSIEVAIKHYGSVPSVSSKVWITYKASDSAAASRASSGDGTHPPGFAPELVEELVDILGRLVLPSLNADIEWDEGGSQAHLLVGWPDALTEGTRGTFDPASFEGAAASVFRLDAMRTDDGEVHRSWYKGFKHDDAVSHGQSRHSLLWFAWEWQPIEEDKVPEIVSFASNDDTASTEE